VPVTLERAEAARRVELVLQIEEVETEFASLSREAAEPVLPVLETLGPVEVARHAELALQIEEVETALAFPSWEAAEPVLPHAVSTRASALHECWHCVPGGTDSL